MARPLRHLPGGADVDALLDVLARDGAVVLDDVLDPAALARLRAELDPFVRATAPGRDAFSGTRTTRTGALVARSPGTRSLVLHPTVLAAARAFLAPWCERIQLHLTQAIRIGPGQEAQPLHRDRWAWGPWLSGLEPQFNTIWALTDFTEANGATRVVPGSTTWADDRRAEPEEVTCAAMRAGSVLCYSGSVFHGGGANRTGGDRIGLNLTYSLAWLRQEENQYLSCPPHHAAALPQELRELLGYTLGSYALGYYTPPVPPGEGPELASPAFAVAGGEGSGEGPGSGLGDPALLRALGDRLKEGVAQEPAGEPGDSR